MNVTKIAALYPFYLDALRQLPTGRRLNDMLATVHLALLLKANAAAVRPNLWVKMRDQDNPCQRFDEQGLPTDEYLRELVPARVFDWVTAQQPVKPTYSDDLAGIQAQVDAYQASRIGWQVTASEVMPTPRGIPGQAVPVSSQPSGGRYLVWTGTQQELASLLQGLRAFRAKRQKAARKLMAQLWVYHLRQQATTRLVEASSLAVAPDGILCGTDAVPVADENPHPAPGGVAPTLSGGLLPRLVGQLRRGLAAKVHQVAVAAEAVLAEGGVAA